MKEWRIKEMSEMTQTSIRMLRHYDKIDLLRPSYRSANGYRCYTEHDLTKLQQIIALKYFGFSLKVSLSEDDFSENPVSAKHLILLNRTSGY